MNKTNYFERSIDWWKSVPLCLKLSKKFADKTFLFRPIFSLFFPPLHLLLIIIINNIVIASILHSHFSASPFKFIPSSDNSKSDSKTFALLTINFHLFLIFNLNTINARIIHSIDIVKIGTHNTIFFFFLCNEKLLYEWMNEWTRGNYVSLYKGEMYVMKFL